MANRCQIIGASDGSRTHLVGLGSPNNTDILHSQNCQMFGIKTVETLVFNKIPYP